MTTIVAKYSCGALRLATMVMAAGLSACNGGGVTASAPLVPTGGGNGGGTTVTASPYILYASNYVVFPNGQVNGSFLASVQGGNVYAGSSTPNVIYGNYSAAASTINATQFYNIQYQWTVAGGNALDFAFVSVLTPGSGQTFTALTPADISQAGKLLIQMGNTYTQSDNPSGSGGSANVFTVVLNNDTSVKQDGSGATAICSFNQTLVTIGRNAATGTASPLGVYNYEIPLSSFTTCSKGSITMLQSTGVTSIAVKITGDQNTAIKPGDLNTIAVGYVGFTL